MCKCCEFLLAFVFPPLAVLSHTGCSGALLFNVVLTSCLWIPGIAHAIYVVCQPEEPQIVLTTNVNVGQPIPMYQPVPPPPAPAYYQPPSAPPPPVYYSEASQKY